MIDLLILLKIIPIDEWVSSVEEMGTRDHDETSNTKARLVIISPASRSRPIKSQNLLRLSNNQPANNIYYGVLSLTIQVRKLVY